MTGHIDFRHYRYAAVSGIRNDFADFLLGIISAITAFPPCACYRKPRIPLYLDPPALIIGKMPVKDIHLVQLHHIDIPFHFGDAEEMAADIKMHSPVAEPRIIRNPAARHFRIHLAESLAGIDKTVQIRCPDGNPVFLHFDRIMLRAETAVFQEYDGCFSGVSCRKGSAAHRNPGKEPRHGHAAHTVR